MKSTITFCTLLLLSIQALSQERIPSFPLEITYYKTTNLIFPYPIKAVDRGSRDVLAQRAPGVENVLQVKARSKGFPSSNLTVFTSDGKLYSFDISYAPLPASQNLSFGGYQMTILSNQRLNDAWLDSMSRRILSQKQFLHVCGSGSSLRLILRSIYYDQHLLWLCLEIKNSSIIDFEPDRFRFFIRDSHLARRTVIQEEELTPVNHQPKDTILGGSSGNLVFAFDPFTVTKGRKMVCEVADQEGHKVVLLKVRAGTLSRPRLIQN